MKRFSKQMQNAMTATVKSTKVIGEPNSWPKALLNESKWLLNKKNKQKTINNKNNQINIYESSSLKDLKEQ